MRSSSLRYASFVALTVTFAAPIELRAQTREELAANPKLLLEGGVKLRKWNEPAEPTKVVGPIYFVGTAGLGSYLITTPEGHILLYTGMPPSGPMIEASIRKLGFDPKDIKLLLTGHAHIDHVGGHAYIQKISGAKVAAMGAEVELIESGGKTDFHYAGHAEFEFDPVKVDRILHDNEDVKLGDVTLTARHTPGHTPGSTTWITHVTDGGKEYTVVFPDGTSVNPGYRLETHVRRSPRLVMVQSYPGIGDDYRRTFKILASLKPDIWLTPHTEVFDYAAKQSRVATEGVNAWVDPEGYQKWLATKRAEFEAQLEKESEATKSK